MPDEKIIVKFPASWKRPDLEIDGGIATLDGAWVDGGGARFNLANLDWMLSMMQMSENMLILNFRGAPTWYELVKAFVEKGLKDDIRQAVRDAVRDALRENYGDRTLGSTQLGSPVRSSEH